MKELITISEQFNDSTEQMEQVVSARELHRFLEVGTLYKDWWRRNVEFLQLEEGRSFLSTLLEIRGQETKDHIITVETAKELCMVSRSEKGSQARKYFLEVERAWNNPMRVVERAMQWLERENSKLIQQVEVKDEKIKQIEHELTEAQPAKDFTRAVTESIDCISVNKFAKLLKTGQNRLFEVFAE
jgi:anti-repressor protein